MHEEPFVDLRHTASFIALNRLKFGQCSHEIYMGMSAGEISVPAHKNTAFLNVLSKDIEEGCVPCIEEQISDVYKMHVDVDYDEAVDYTEDSGSKDDSLSEHPVIGNFDYLAHAKTIRDVVGTCVSSSSLSKFQIKAVVTLSAEKIGNKWKEGDISTIDDDIVHIITDDGDVAHINKSRVRPVGRGKRHLTTSSSISSFEKHENENIDRHLTRVTLEPGLRVRFNIRVKKVAMHVVFPDVVVMADVGIRLLREIRVALEVKYGQRLKHLNSWSDAICEKSHLGETRVRMCYSDRSEDCTECKEKYDDIDKQHGTEEIEDVLRLREKDLSMNWNGKRIIGTLTIKERKKAKKEIYKSSVCEKSACVGRMRREGRPHLPVWILVGNCYGCVPFTGSVFKALCLTSIRCDGEITPCHTSTCGTLLSSKHDVIKPVDPRLHVLSSIIRTSFGYKYSKLVITAARFLRDSFFIDVYGPMATYCHKTRSEHAETNIYFVISKIGICQKCHLHSKYESKIEMITLEQRSILF